MKGYEMNMGNAVKCLLPVSPSLDKFDLFYFGCKRLAVQGGVLVVQMPI